MITDRGIQLDNLPAPATGAGPSAPLSLTRPHNLPVPVASLVGRTEAVAEVQRLVRNKRLVTLTGPGGVGKTRLALEVASGLLGSHDDGAWWVDLAPLADAGLVAHAVAAALRAPEDPAGSRLETLVGYLWGKDLLLVLDNCEHLIGACAELAAHLLSALARLRIMATSREALGVKGETVWTVPGLTLPCLEGTATAESVLESEAGELFVERAQAVRPDFRMTDAAARAIAEVCCRLDGIPLAIELAAARVQVLPVPQIAAHLDDVFGLLTSGSRTGLRRHQTIEATIQWSYDLLTGPEQVVFQRLAVFVSTFSFDAARAVASDPAGQGPILPQAVLDLLSQLVQKSLVAVREGEGARYSMLDTIRQYAWRRLAASGELDRLRQRHLAYYLDLAQRAESKLAGPGQKEWLELLETEHDNLRAALLWSQESETRESWLSLASTLAPFWIRVGYLSEGSGWLERALAGDRTAGPVRIKALYEAARLAQRRGDYEQALKFARKSMALSRCAGDRGGSARALGLRGWIAHLQGDRDRASQFLEESLALARESGDERTTARTRLLLADLRQRQGALDEAASLFEESRRYYEKTGDGWGLAWALGGLGAGAGWRGDHEVALAYLQLSLALYRDLDSKSEIPYPLEVLALVAAEQDQSQRAVHLWAAANGLRDTVHSHLPPSYEGDYAPKLEKTRASLGEEAFAAAWAKGREMTLDQVLALAAEVPRADGHRTATALTEKAAHDPRSAEEEHGLTPREVEVLQLLACGLTDAEIAEELVISPRTVGKHVQWIYSKLYLHTRSAATRWAIEHGLG